MLQTNIPDFRQTDAEVYRRFSDFLGLHEKLVEKHLHQGRIIPPPPEKSVIGMQSIVGSNYSTAPQEKRQRYTIYSRVELFHCAEKSVRGILFIVYSRVEVFHRPPPKKCCKMYMYCVCYRNDSYKDEGRIELSRVC